MFLGAHHVEGEVGEARVDHDLRRMDEVQHALDGHDPHDGAQLPRLLAVRNDLGSDFLPDLIAGLELGKRHTVRQYDRAFGGGPEGPGFAQRQRVQVGDDLGLRVAERSHLDPPGHPGALLGRGLEDLVVLP